LGEIADRVFIRHFVEGGAADEEMFGDEGDVTFQFGSAADEGLAAGVGEGFRADIEEALDAVAGLEDVGLHTVERVMFEGVVAGEFVVAAAGVGEGVVADFVAVGNGALPGVVTFFDPPYRDEERGFEIGGVEEGQAGVDLAGAGVVKAEADGGAFVVGPVKSIGIGSHERFITRREMRCEVVSNSRSPRRRFRRSETLQPRVPRLACRPC
jgi:hypothetical protein